MSSSVNAQQKQLYAKLDRFVRDRVISLAEFWYSDRICVDVETFVQMLQMISFQVKNQQITKLQQQTDIISLQNVIENVDYWKQSQVSVSLYLSKNSPKKQEKNVQKVQNSVSNKSRLSQNSNFYTNKKFLDEHARRELKNKIKLSNTLIYVKNQSNYELSIKVGQANDICSKLKNMVTYILQIKQNGNAEIIRTQTGKEQKISDKKFYTQYEELKLKMMNIPQEIQGTLEEDLKKVLVQVMCLSTQIKDQIKLLERKGISH